MNLAKFVPDVGELPNLPISGSSYIKSSSMIYDRDKADMDAFMRRTVPTGYGTTRKFININNNYGPAQTIVFAKAIEMYCK